MERTLYEEWLNRVRLFSLEKWSQKGDAMELDKIMKKQNKQKKQPTNFSLFANKRNKWPKADGIFGLVGFSVWVFGLGFFWGVVWGVVTTCSATAQNRILGLLKVYLNQK